VARVIVEKRA